MSLLFVPIFKHDYHYSQHLTFYPHAGITLDSDSFNFAAKAKDPDALFLRGVKLSGLVNALKCYCEAAEAGHALACVRVSQMLAQGERTYQKFFLERYPELSSYSSIES